MLRRIDNMTVSFVPKLFRKRKGRLGVTIGRKWYSVKKVSRAHYQAQLLAQRSFPVHVVRIDGRTYWQFQERFYWENDGLDARQVHALVVTQQQREQGRVERAQAMVATGLAPQNQKRRRDVIPDDVKQMVWLRDGGRCRHCGATSELQFDHVIPFALGGASGPENLQVLCGPCNRRKSAGLTVR